MTTGGHVVTAADFPSSSASMSESDERKTARRGLLRALDRLLQSTPPELLAGRLWLLRERAEGGQAVVQVRNRVALDTVAERPMSKPTSLIS